MQYAIKVSGLKKSYGKVRALKGVSFKIKKGEIFGFLGPNGAGKSTTINILAGLLNKDSGSIKIFGKDIESVKQYMNIANAYSNLTGILTVNQNLKVFGRLYNVKEIQKRIDTLLKEFEIEDLKDRRVQDLSSGQSTRVNLCKGLINSPKILLLDECTVGLDPIIAEKTRQIIKQFNKKNKTSILFTSHIMHEVEELCDRVAFISKGKILTIGTPSTLRRLIKKQTVDIKFFKHAEPIADFLKSFNINIIYLKKNRIIFEMDNASKKIQNIMELLIKKGFKIKDIHIRKPNLVDVFVKIAKGEIK